MSLLLLPPSVVTTRGWSMSSCCLHLGAGVGGTEVWGVGGRLVVPYQDGDGSKRKASQPPPIDSSHPIPIYKHAPRWPRTSRHRWRCRPWSPPKGPGRFGSPHPLPPWCVGGGRKERKKPLGRFFVSLLACGIGWWYGVWSVNRVESRKWAEGQEC